jgi:hypothetical protein
VINEGCLHIFDGIEPTDDQSASEKLALSDIMKSDHEDLSLKITLHDKSERIITFESAEEVQNWLSFIQPQIKQQLRTDDIATTLPLQVTTSC